MDNATTPMSKKPLVNVTCKLGTKGCFEDGKCHALCDCENKITTNADRIRAMSDEELAEAITGAKYCNGKCPPEWGCLDCCFAWLVQPARGGENE